MEINKGNELYYNYLSTKSGKWCMKHATIGALADSFYEYLLKLWIYKDKSEPKILDMYLRAMNGIQSHLLDVSSTNLTYFGDYNSARLVKKMDHLACFSGGLLAYTSVSVKKLNKYEKTKYLNLAKDITNTCHESYIRTPIHIGPESFHFERPDTEAMAIKNEEKYYILRPEVIRIKIFEFLYFIYFINVFIILK
jgi:mannosyl-oligosaccharide alpha-1,2-mannosidase